VYKDFYCILFLVYCSRSLY